MCHSRNIEFPTVRLAKGKKEGSWSSRPVIVLTSLSNSAVTVSLLRNRSRRTGSVTGFLSVDRLTTLGCPLLFRRFSALAGADSIPAARTSSDVVDLIFSFSVLF